MYTVQRECTSMLLSLKSKRFLISWNLVSTFKIFRFIGKRWSIMMWFPDIVCVTRRQLLEKFEKIDGGSEWGTFPWYDTNFASVGQWGEQFSMFPVALLSSITFANTESHFLSSSLHRTGNPWTRTFSFMLSYFPRQFETLHLRGIMIKKEI